MSDLTLRPALVMRGATIDDVEAAVEMFNLSWRKQTGADEFTLEELRSEWLAPDFNLQNDTQVIFAPNGQLVGYVEVLDQVRPSMIWVWGRVHPDYEGQGIGSVLMDWAESRAREAMTRLPDDVRVVMRSSTISTYTPMVHFFEYLGMQPVRTYWRMTIELDSEPTPPVMPEGITLRTAIKGQDERAVLGVIRNSFKDHWGYVEIPFEENFETWMHMWNGEKGYDPSLWFIAEQDGEVVGVSLCHLDFTDDPDMGYIAQVGVLREHRRKGIALALLQQSFCEIYKRGKKRAGLGVDADSLTGATRVYEKAGMSVALQFDTYEKELRPGRDITTQTLE